VRNAYLEREHRVRDRVVPRTDDLYCIEDEEDQP
jgi:hypothetical protein